MVAVASASTRSQRSLWLALVSGPAAWLVDEGISLLVTAHACSGPPHVLPWGMTMTAFVGVGALALAAIGAGLLTARGWLRDQRAGNAIAIAGERARFLAQAAMLLGGLAAFGVLLRLVSALASPVCS